MGCMRWWRMARARIAEWTRVCVLQWPARLPKIAVRLRWERDMGVRETVGAGHVRWPRAGEKSVELGRPGYPIAWRDRFGSNDAAALVKTGRKIGGKVKRDLDYKILIKAMS